MQVFFLNFATSEEKLHPKWAKFEGLLSLKAAKTKKKRTLSAEKDKEVRNRFIAKKQTIILKKQSIHLCVEKKPQKNTCTIFQTRNPLKRRDDNEGYWWVF